jgi:hypothetical protein
MQNPARSGITDIVGIGRAGETEMKGLGHESTNCARLLNGIVFLVLMVDAVQEMDFLSVVSLWPVYLEIWVE